MDCGSCTLCCKLLNIEATQSGLGEYCIHCEPSIGCRIYPERPSACKQFECAWKQMAYVIHELRPDVCNVVFEKWSDCVMVGIVGGELSDVVNRQIDGFRGEGISVLMVDNAAKSRTFFLAPGHTKDFVRREIHGSAKLH